MKQISLTKFKQMPVRDIEEGGCFQLVADGVPVAQVIVGAKEEMRNRIEGIASQIDSGRGVK